MTTDKNTSNELEYNGGFYEEIGDFLRENYFNYGFTKGTDQEVNFLEKLMELQKDARILDIGCGTGRHSLELARRGYQPVGIDISSEFIKYANKEAEDQNLPAEFFAADARELNYQREFDGAICLCQGAFGLAGNEENHRKVLKGVYRALRPGSLFVLTVINALNLARNLTEDAEFDPYSCTVIDKETITSPEGKTKKVPIYTTAFTYRELKLLLESEGFEVNAAYGCVAGNFGKTPLKVNSYEIMMIARRQKE
ncbi:cyclopropane-fatty-acyl-phospholipid synthase [Bacillus sp. M6-12]|uniref:class I SAM-dependent methyltransferase n=1 Tax=Bacillus sp. M6-12 TaxID=2054166 RepID=UPI000C7946EB|nr:class I SAM-dependent methyltransferase [Bacillus sp. M6-12]PLS15716.1 cyclopropane-fatty-acyl-phospholipid synthase [Bacillus sp. M6-12]